MKKLFPLMVVLAFGLALPLDSDARGGGRSHAGKGKTVKTVKVAKAPARSSAKGSRSAKGSSGGSGGCGSKGGPGYRKANGKCAGWKG